jgi:hypothetical protein
MSLILREDLAVMYAKHLAWSPSGEMSAAAMATDPFDTDRAFMFGTFDPTEEISLEGILALDEAILGIREDGDSTLAAARSHSHGEPAGGDSSAFMFGVHPEQPSVPPPGDWLLYVSVTEPQ